MKLLGNFGVISLFVLIIGIGEGICQDGKTPEDQAKGIMATGLIYGEMAQENMGQYIKELKNASTIMHSSQALSDEIKKAVEAAEKAVEELTKSLKSAQDGLTAK